MWSRMRSAAGPRLACLALVAAATGAPDTGGAQLRAAPPTTVAGATAGVQVLRPVITMVRGSTGEARTKAQLERLLSAYDLDQWTFTGRVMIDEQSVPHSHPVLTLHTRHLRDDDLLLSTYCHEQLHWWLTANPARTAAAMADIRAAFPDLPVGYPQESEDADGNAVHVLVAWLEWQALQSMVGELRARQVMTFWADDHYTRIYQAVLERPEVARSIVRTHRLMPPRR